MGTGASESLGLWGREGGHTQAGWRVGCELELNGKGAKLTFSTTLFCAPGGS